MGYFSDPLSAGNPPPDFNQIEPSQNTAEIDQGLDALFGVVNSDDENIKHYSGFGLDTTAYKGEATPHITFKTAVNTIRAAQRLQGGESTKSVKEERVKLIEKMAELWEAENPLSAKFKKTIPLGDKNIPRRLKQPKETTEQVLRKLDKGKEMRKEMNNWETLAGYNAATKRSTRSKVGKKNSSTNVKKTKQRSPQAKQAWEEQSIKEIKQNRFSSQLSALFKKKP